MKTNYTARTTKDSNNKRKKAKEAKENTHDKGRSRRD